MVPKKKVVFAEVSFVKFFEEVVNLSTKANKQVKEHET